MTEAYHLRGGKLWLAFELKNYEEIPFGVAYSESQRLLIA